MNRILCFLNAGCNHSHHLRWLERLKSIIGRIESAADLDGFEFFYPSLCSLIEDGSDRSIRFAVWMEKDNISDLDNLPSITSKILRDYADGLLAAAERIDAGGQGVTL